MINIIKIMNVSFTTECFLISFYSLSPATFCLYIPHTATICFLGLDLFTFFWITYIYIYICNYRLLIVFLSAWLFWGSSMLMSVSIFHSFYGKVPLHVDILDCLPIYFLMNIWVVSLEILYEAMNICIQVLIWTYLPFK
jgi:hypothetical protein